MMRKYIGNNRRVLSGMLDHGYVELWKFFYLTSTTSDFLIGCRLFGTDV